MKKSKIKLLVFDFDGTIADTKKLYYNSIHKWLKKEKIVFSEKQFKKFFGLKVHDILAKLRIRGDIKKITEKINADVFKNINKIKVSESVEYIKELNADKIIASNTPTRYMGAILRKNGLLKYFMVVCGGDKFVHKEDFIKKYIKNKKLNRKNVFYIGDMVKDVEIARKAGCVCVAVSHNISWSSRKDLLKAKPDFILNSLKDLSRLF